MEKDEKKVMVVGAMIFCTVSFLIGFQFAVYVYGYDKTTPQHSIPSPSVVNAYCVDNGYKYGWVSNSCTENQVMCYKEMNGWSRYDCLSWR